MCVCVCVRVCVCVCMTLHLRLYINMIMCASSCQHRGLFSFTSNSIKLAKGYKAFPTSMICKNEISMLYQQTAL